MDHFVPEMQAWESHSAQPWPCFSCAQSFGWLLLAWHLRLVCSGRPGHCGSHGPLLPTPCAPGHSSTLFPEGSLCPPTSVSLLTLFFLPFTLITYILLDAIQMPMPPPPRSLPGLLDYWTVSTLGLLVTHPSPWEAEQCSGKAVCLGVGLACFNPAAATS